MQHVPKDMPSATIAQQIAQVAIAFERERTGHAPKSVTVVMSDKTLVITLHGGRTGIITKGSAP